MESSDTDLVYVVIVNKLFLEETEQIQVSCDCEFFFSHIKSGTNFNRLQRPFQLNLLSTTKWRITIWVEGIRQKNLDN